MNNSKHLYIGVISEGDSDFEVLKELIKKIKINNEIVLKRKIGKGCSRIKTKCNSFATILKNQNCKKLIIIHDLDDKKYDILYNQLKLSIEPSPIIDYKIIIPIKAIEAWLLSDMKAILKTFNYDKFVKEIPNTERIHKPKDHLNKLVKNRFKKTYLNTVHNKKIASHMDLKKLLKYSSFKHLYDFIIDC